MSSHRVAQTFDIVLDNAPTILEVAGDALSLLPIPGLTLAVKGLSGIVDAVKATRVNGGARRAFMAEVMALSNTLKNMLRQTDAAVQGVVGDKDAEKALIQDIERSQVLLLRVQTLESTINNLKNRMKDLKGGPGIRGFLKGVIYSSQNEGTLTDMKEKLASAIRVFTFEGQVSIETVLGDVIGNAKELIQNTKEIRRAQQKEDDEKVLDAIPRESAGYRCVDELKSGFLDGTRAELLQELDSWSAGEFPEDDPKQVYFLSGGAGLGKSSIAHRLCTCLGEPTLGASFFFGRGNIESTRRFFSTLAYQLAMSQPAIRPHIVDAAREHHKQGHEQQMRYTFEDLLRAPLASASLSTHSPVVIVVDGLDECKERDKIPVLLQFVLEIVCAHPGIRVFIAARPEPHILSALASAETTATVYHRSLEDTLDEWAGDVQYYLEETIPKMSPYNGFVRDHPEFLERLISRANGVFIFARIAVNFLDTNRNHPNPQDQFELLLSPVGGAGLSPLDALYLQILISAFPPEELRRSPSRHSQLQSFLTIIALQRRPLTPEAMELLWSGLSKANAIWMTDQLRSALLMDSNGCVLPLHATFGEFLVDQNRCTDPLYRVNSSRGHGKLALRCIAAFTFENMSGYLTAADGALLKQFIFNAKSDWDVHLGQAEVNDELKKYIEQLISAQIPCYARALGWKEDAEPGFCAATRQWLKGSEDAAQISIEYAKSVAYSERWWEIALESPSLRTNAEATLPNIEAENIVHRSLRILGRLDNDESQLVVTSSDIARYEAAHKELVKRIWDEDMQEIWFNPKLGHLDFSYFDKENPTEAIL
ncbi:AAA-16 domain-containing protein [Mycena sanguinolenta]|uniref:AAA-16 domain-containing protein n=1 Tax=Mycena sanguinolenta TaxID=230812 RepID=A0A8H6X8K7_9AGAR|nr:AAA-16 domain-containing protein [Mycena sanguinolenta]